jgi:hypothetical protein
MSSARAPEPVAVALVGWRKARGADLRAARAGEQEGSGDVGFVVEVAGHDEGARLVRHLGARQRAHD